MNCKIEANFNKNEFNRFKANKIIPSLKWNGVKNGFRRVRLKVT